eukprot:88511-Pleurochrysis_carterae.AAC.2
MHSVAMPTRARNAPNDIRRFAEAVPKRGRGPCGTSVLVWDQCGGSAGLVRRRRWIDPSRDRPQAVGKRHYRPAGRVYCRSVRRSRDAMESGNSLR